MAHSSSTFGRTHGNQQKPQDSLKKKTVVEIKFWAHDPKKISDAISILKPQNMGFWTVILIAFKKKQHRSFRGIKPSSFDQQTLMGPCAKISPKSWFRMLDF